MNKYRFPYRAPQVQAISQAMRHATSQATNRPKPPPTTSNALTKTPVTRTKSRPDSNQVGRSNRVGSPSQDQVGRSNQVGSPGQDQIGHLNLQGDVKGGTPIQSTSIRIPHVQRIRSKRLPNIRVFNDTVVQSVIAIKTIHLETKNTTSLEVLTAPFNVIELDQALKEDVLG